MSRKTIWLLTVLLRLNLLVALFKLPTCLYAQHITPPPPESITDRQGLPQSFVPAIVQDKQGFIWLATLDGLARYDGNYFKVFHPTSDGRPGLSSAGLENLLTDPQGNLWIKTYQGDLDWFDTRRETVVNFSRLPLYQKHVGLDTLESFYPDKRNRLWVWLRNKGLVCFDHTNQSVQRYRHVQHKPASLVNNIVTAVIDDGLGRIWVATSDGLERLDERTSTFIHYRHRATDKNTIPDNHIRAMHRRKNGDLLLLSERHLAILNHRTGQVKSVSLPARNALWWRHHIATDSKGNDYIDGFNQLLRVHQPIGDSTIQVQALTQPTREWRSIGLFVDRSDVLWVGTDATGVRKFNLKAGLFEIQPYHTSFHVDLLTDIIGVARTEVPRFGNGINSYNLRSTLDRAGRLWFTVGSTPFYRFDFHTKHLTSIPFPVQFQETQSDHPALLATDPAGRVWALHDSLIFWYDELTCRWQRFPHSIRRTSQPTNQLSVSSGQLDYQSAKAKQRQVTAIESPILQLVVDEKALWVITGSRGLYQVNRLTGQIRHYTHQPADSTTLSSNNLYCLFADSEDPNTLWVGTVGAGLCRFNKRTGRCQRITTQNGLPNNVIYAAIPDRIGNVWIATNRGLCQLNRRTGKTHTYTREDGLSANEFNRFHSVHLPGRGAADDKIILGGTEGITMFNPDRLTEDTYQPVSEITGLRINNQSIGLKPHSLLGGQPAQMARQLILAHNQNFLAVEFAALQFNNPSKQSYRYHLDGIDRDWVITNQPEAIYTNLSPGTYTLYLNAANTSGQWSRHIRTLSITIKSPWWATWWAKLLYTCVAGGILIGLVRGYERRREARQLRAVAEMKERFFANITHELRTPLTLILGPTEKLKSAVQEPFWLDMLSTIDRNAHQLMNLINQLLDLSRLEAGIVTVNEHCGDVSLQVSQVVESIRPLAAAKDIQLVFMNHLSANSYWYDPDKLERILLNLLTNAVKFTQQGSITVILEPGIRLTVEDTGIGIPTDQQKHIFSRFYQVTKSASLTGAGIGLALVNELVTVQGGSITVESPLNSPKVVGPLAFAGTRFTVELPYRLTVTEAKSIKLPDEVPLLFVEGDGDSESPLILVVEDNTELGDFISNCLTPQYRILRATDGIEGLEKALTHWPDLVLSDVVMNRMDGVALCRALKNDVRTSHIPVLLLTAKVTVDDRLTGLLGGADDYITKPFHVRELQLRVSNLFGHQQRQRVWFRNQMISPANSGPIKSGQTNEIAGGALSPVDPFLTKLEVLMHQHLDDTGFGVEELASEVNMSRVHLYRKVKALTGLPVNELMRNYRLKEATRLLGVGHPVTETGYLVGFDTPSYFTKCFRALYGLTPSDYQKQIKDSWKPAE